MGLLDRLFGGNRGGGQDQPPRDASRTQGPQDTPVSGRGGPRPATGDDAAIQRYRYLLRTAPPEAIEQAHAEAFAALTPEQRRTVLTELGSQVPASERAASDDPQALARMATRAEMRQPGHDGADVLRAGHGGMGGMGMGGVLAGGLFASLAGAFVGTAIANEIFDDDQGRPTATTGTTAVPTRPVTSRATRSTPRAQAATATTAGSATPAAVTPSVEGTSVRGTSVVEGTSAVSTRRPRRPVLVHRPPRSPSGRAVAGGRGQAGAVSAMRTDCPGTAWASRSTSASRTTAATG